ncbi:MAG: GTP-binding protein, partial [Bacteroidota bacterium]|nr:GTP-binding protein [Bacteroidota bacterium]
MSQLVNSKEYPTTHIRTIALIGHGGSGKTTFSEASLFATGVINRQGRVEDGNTISDYHPDEVERKISINASILTTEVNDIKINILDTPGYTDFTGEVKAALRVVDSAVVLVKGFEGVEVGTEIVWSYVNEYSVPSLFVVNKMDGDNSNFDQTIAAIKDRCSFDAAVLTFPAQSGNGFNAVIDVLRMKLLRFIPSTKGTYSEEDIPADLKDKASQLHEELIEKIAESDEALMDKFFQNGTLSNEEIKKGLHQGLVGRKIYPIFAASSSTNVGVSNILDFVANFCPPPSEFAKVKAMDAKTKKDIEVSISAHGETSLFVF